MKNFKIKCVYLKNQILYRLKYLRCYLPERRKAVQEYPTTIQLPITYLCNFDCVMCGMKGLIKKPHFTPKELATILQDELFKNVKSVGLNGGEPFLRDDLVECIETIVDKIPSLKEFYFISNGYFTDKILGKLSDIKKLCDKKEIKVNISISVDGIGDMQDFMRGRKGAWDNALQTMQKIKEDKNSYCDYLNVICTITKYNIYRIEEVECWAKKIGIDVAYNVATENVRIDNYEKLEDFTIYNDEEARRMTMEFFYKKAMTENSMRYFAIYLFVKDHKRYASCDCASKGWVTLTPDSQIGYCATHSKNLGNAQEESAYQIFQRNTPYLNELKTEKCEGCSHYMYGLNHEGLRMYYKDKLRNIL